MAALGSALLGCGGRTSLDDTASNAPALPTDDEASAPDAGSESGLPAGPLYGMVLAETATLSGVQSSASAEFFVDQNPTCALAGAPGECSIAECSNADTSRGVGAGLLSIDGGSQPALLAPRLPTAFGGVAYESWNGVGAAFLPGQLLTFSADGTGGDGAEGAVPPFHAEVRFPEKLTVLEPSFNQGAILYTQQDGGAAITLTWTPGSTDEVLFFMRSPTRGTHRNQLLTCFFPSATGQASVPSDLFYKLDSSVNPTRTGLIPIVRKAVHVERGGTKWAIEVAALGQGAEGDVRLPRIQFR